VEAFARLVKGLESEMAGLREDLRRANEALASRDATIEKLSGLVEGLNARMDGLSEENARLLAQISELTASLKMTEEQKEAIEKQAEEKMAVFEKVKKELDAANGVIRGLRAMQNKSEKIRKPGPADEEAWKRREAEKAARIKARGNNGAKRRMDIEVETVERDIFPALDPSEAESAKWFSVTRDTVTFRMVPPKIIREVAHIHRCAVGGRIVEGETPFRPFNNSPYDASFIAGLLDYRFSCGLPVERTVKHLSNHGFDLNKSTAHDLIKRTAELLEPLHKALGVAVKSEKYVHEDETYYRVIINWDPEDAKKMIGGKLLKKGYMWSILGAESGLIYIFYDHGSRRQEIILKEMAGYTGTIQADGLYAYKKVRDDSDGKVTLLSCLQHCKRKMKDIEGNADADRVVWLINTLYRKEGLHKIGQKGWTTDDNLKWRRRYAPPRLAALRQKLEELAEDKRYPPKSQMAQAVNYILGEWSGIEAIFTRGDYALDNSAIERAFRPISVSRRNSLFFGSHEGARKGAILYSLAISAGNLGLNVYEYMEDIITRAAKIPPKATDEEWQRLLPNNWKIEKEGKAE